MFCYVAYSLLDWPGIHTCLITCYIVSLGTAAETAEKLTLRVLGCLIGAATGTAAIVFLMPAVASIGALMAVFIFVAAFISGWVAAGSPRISYVGFQLAFAFFLCVVQGAAPAFDMTIARDRLIGILFGNIAVAVVFTLVWPVSIAGRIDPAIASLLRRFSASLLQEAGRSAGHLPCRRAPRLAALSRILSSRTMSLVRPSPARLAGSPAGCCSHTLRRCTDLADLGDADVTASDRVARRLGGSRISSEGAPTLRGGSVMTERPR